MNRTTAFTLANTILFVLPGGDAKRIFIYTKNKSKRRTDSLKKRRAEQFYLISHTQSSFIDYTETRRGALSKTTSIENGGAAARENKKQNTIIFHHFRVLDTTRIIKTTWRGVVIHFALKPIDIKRQNKNMIGENNQFSFHQNKKKRRTKKSNPYYNPFSLLLFLFVPFFFPDTRSCRGNLDRRSSLTICSWFLGYGFCRGGTISFSFFSRTRPGKEKTGNMHIQYIEEKEEVKGILYIYICFQSEAFFENAHTHTKTMGSSLDFLFRMKDLERGRSKQKKIRVVCDGTSLSIDVNRRQSGAILDDRTD